MGTDIKPLVAGSGEPVRDVCPFCWIGVVLSVQRIRPQVTCTGGPGPADDSFEARATRRGQGLAGKQGLPIHPERQPLPGKLTLSGVIALGSASESITAFYGISCIAPVIERRHLYLLRGVEPPGDCGSRIGIVRGNPHLDN